MAFCKNCGAQIPDGAGFCNHCGAAQAQQPQQTQMQQPQMQQPQMQPQKKSKKGLIIGLSVGGTVLLSGIVVLILFLTGVFGGKDDVFVHGEKTQVISEPNPDPEPQPQPDPNDPSTLSGEMGRWSVVYFGISLPVEWDELVFEYPSNVHRAPNYQELTLSIEEDNWITLTPCSDQNIIQVLENGYELVGILTLPNGYPLYLTMDFHADPSTETGAWMKAHKEELIDSICALDGATLEKGIIYTGAPMLDMTGYSGTWNSETGLATLTIESDGGFSMTNSAEGATEKETLGYLVYHDGVYYMYDEFDQPFGGGREGDSYLHLNEDDTLALVEGMGAVRFYHEAAGDNQNQDGPTEFKPLYGSTWSIDGVEGTASIEFDFDNGFIMYYANGNTEATGSYFFYEMNGALYCGLERDDGITIDLKAYYSEGAGQYILEHNGVYYMEIE